MLIFVNTLIFMTGMILMIFNFCLTRFLETLDELGNFNNILRVHPDTKTYLQKKQINCLPQSCRQRLESVDGEKFRYDSVYLHFTSHV